MNSIATKTSSAARPVPPQPSGGALASFVRRLFHRPAPTTSDVPHIVIAGHVNGSYSLAAVNRGLARSIERLHPGTVHVVPVEGTITTDLSGVPEGEAIGHLVQRRKVPGARHVVISQHYPVHVPDNTEDAALALFYWEETLVPIETVRCLNRSFRGVLAPSAFVAKALVDSGVTVPVWRVGQAPQLDDFRRIGAARRERRREVLSFLHVSSCMARKGVDVLLAAYIRAFRRGDNVQLVLKGFPNPHNDIGARVARIRATDPDAPEIVVVNQDLSRQDLLSLYEDADVMVLPTRGEGFNLPAAEAMAAGLSLIVTGFGGHMDFCSTKTARLLDFRLAPSQSHVTGGHALWAEPSQDDLVAALREARAMPPASRARLRHAAEAVDAATSEPALVRRLMHAATTSLQKPADRPPAILIDHHPVLRPWSAVESLTLLHLENGRPVAIRLGSTDAIDAASPAVLAQATRVIVPDLACLEHLMRAGLWRNLVMIPDAAAEQLQGMLLGLAQSYEPAFKGASASG
jgi:glycosyltransferase involved in cell wall biosynthesis